MRLYSPNELTRIWREDDRLQKLQEALDGKMPFLQQKGWHHTSMALTHLWLCWIGFQLPAGVTLPRNDQ